ncbi:dihydrolipoamide acetyltransferase family protein [Dactylosporangium matsuzakiense]|uniref:Dihydrolipoamide acetyltransferase component of pyruvate dehydrogenase complex n=1 Tax=Dactylosporangium matsuzakiense TaxID=53360 RepID=A0A9W6KHX2_9ACTN|nr:dihydrolipoamide acetyltransferase family protein [Dactylosporangium matsuzakiense]UWZ48802.1 2-oxo acid dehydrogenase subunit E2 [Dactylosporangium matsuzakiense]GLL01095.1 dihydrolipoamide acetyltransferase component of pyruvate dehydrogenase complex [Dactylosporangium matsuzakiense]
MTAQTFLLPDLGEGLTEAELVRWLVAEGDQVAVDQSIAEVETAKALVEVPSPYAGRVSALHAKAGETVGVGKALITVEHPSAAAYREEERAGAQVAQPASEGAQPAGGGSGNVLIGYGTSESGATGRKRRPRAAAPSAGARPAGRAPLVMSPLVRNLARSHGVDLHAVPATGPGGVITRADVERAAAAATPAPTAPGEHRVPMTGFRKAVSAALTRSRTEIPEATVWVDVDATALWNLRESAAAGPGLLAYIARFVVAGLQQYPVLNARIDTERQEIVTSDRINLGIAVQGERGLVVPAVIGAERMTTAQLDTEIRRLTAAAREGRTTPQEQSAGTFTLNNYGAFRVDGSAAIINHPQVAILGVGRIIDRPWVVEGRLCVRKVTQLSFVFDHRVCDGGTAAGFIRSVADAMEDPASIIARL